MKAHKRLADGADRLLGSVFGAPAMLLLEFSNCFQFPKCLRFDRLGLTIVVQDGFELLFLPQKGAECLSVVQGEAAFLDSGVALQGRGFPGGWVGDLLEAELIAVQLRDFGDEVQGVNGVLRGIGEQMGDVEDTALVPEFGFLAIENELPNSEAFADGVAWGWGGWRLGARGGVDLRLLGGFRLRGLPGPEAEQAEDL